MTINPFNQFGHNWWNLEDGEFKLLHLINPLRMSYIIDSASKHFNRNKKSNAFFKGLNVLDVGCGGGLISTPVGRLGGRVTGIDPSPPAIEAAIKKADKENLNNINYLCCTPEDLVTKESFDIVLCMDVLEHVESLSELIKTITNLIKPNGLIIISTINKTVKSFLQAILFAENVLRILPKGTHEYEKLIPPWELELEFNKYQFSINQIMGIKYSILRRNWELNDNDIDVNYIATIVKGA